MMRKRDVLGALGASLIAASQSSSASSADVFVTTSAIQGDLALLKRVYTNLHPGLYRYNSPRQIDAAFSALSRQFDAPTTLPKLYLALSRFLAGVRCGHSYANFYSQSDAVQSALFSGTNRLPFAFMWIDGEMVVTNPAGCQGLVRGARITRVNNVATPTILRTLLPYVRADGHNVGKQTSLLSVNRDEGYQTFDIFYALHFGATSTFEVRGKSPNGTNLALTLPAIGLQARRAMTAPPALPAEAPRWSLVQRDDKTALMTMPTWGLYSDAWDWKAWLRDAFTQIKTGGVSKLIIDLRTNEGGRDDCGPEILGYLTEKPLPAQAGQRRVRYRKIADDLNQVLETWDDSFRDWGDKAVARGDGLFDLISDQGRSGGGVTPTMPHFGGKVIVLTDASNSSATLQFCQMFRANGLGRIIGETTGGNLRGINAEKFMFCRLPATGLEVDVPLVGFFPDGSPRDSGLVPDVVVTQTWRDVAQGNDAIMARAVRYDV
jgi:Peptidase family S41